MEAWRKRVYQPERGYEGSILTMAGPRELIQKNNRGALQIVGISPLP